MPDFHIQHQIEEISFDYLVSVDEQGQITDVKPMFYQLPKIAQKMIIGDQELALERRIKAYPKLVPFILKLILHDRLHSFKEAYRDIAAYVRSVSKQVQEPLEKPLWSCIEDLIVTKNNSSAYDICRKIAYNYHETCTEFFPGIIPFLPSYNAQRVAFDNMHESSAISSKSYLIEELLHPLSTPYASGIIKAISRIKGKETVIFDAIILFYNREGEKSEDALYNISKVLAYYPCEQSKKIGLEILSLNKRYSSNGAASMLINVFDAKQEVVDILLPHFLQADPKISEAAFSVFCSTQLREYLPSTTKILDIYISTIEKGQNLNIAYSMPSIAKNTGLLHYGDHIYQSLQKDNAYVQEALLILISFFINEAGGEKFQASRFLNRYFELLKSNRSETIRNALSLIGKIGAKTQYNYIGICLEVFLSNQKNVLILLSAMWAINHQINSMPEFDEQIIAPYLEALEHPNLNIRKAALNGLKFSNAPAIQKRLLQLVNDPSEEVRREALKLKQ